MSGKEGDRINAILAAAGYNFRKLLRRLFFVFMAMLTERWQEKVRTLAGKSQLSPSAIGA